jgi:Glycoside hydrolase 123, N-terminal domain
MREPAWSGMLARMRQLATFVLRAMVLGALLAAPLATRASPPATDVPRRAASSRWDASTLGNHRVVVTVPPGAVGVVRADVPWRRRDSDPESKNLIVTDAGNAPISNVVRRSITRERGEILFEPVGGPGHYFIYFLPWESAGRSNYPRVTYPEPRGDADPAWVARALAPSAPWFGATVEAIESIDAMSQFDEMEVITTAAEAAALTGPYRDAGWFAVPEDRAHPLRMRHDLPKRWIDRVTDVVSGEALRGEYFAFQLAVVALKSVVGATVRFTELAGDGGRTLPAGALSCINTEGVDWMGHEFTKTVDIAEGEVQAIWCGLDVPSEASPGAYRGEAILSAPGFADLRVRLAITVLPDSAERGGADEPWKQTRLKWLNSTLAQENTVVAPYTPIVVRGRQLSILGRDIELGDTGLPARIRTFFTEEMTSIGTSPNDVLATPIRLVAARPDGSLLELTGGAPSFTEQSPGTVRWSATSRAASLRLEAQGTLEFDGFLSYQLALTSDADIDLADVRLELPYRTGASTYMMGLGQKGGARPSRLDWTWSVSTRNQDGAWIGGVNAGLSFSLRDETYVRPLNTNFYLQKPLLLPVSWGNEGRGGITIGEREGEVAVTAFSGRRRLEAGTTLRFDVNFLVTPFHPLARH